MAEWVMGVGMLLSGAASVYSAATAETPDYPDLPDPDAAARDAEAEAKRIAGERRKRSGETGRESTFNTSLGGLQSQAATRKASLLGV